MSSVCARKIFHTAYTQYRDTYRGNCKTFITDTSTQTLWDLWDIVSMKSLLPWSMNTCQWEVSFKHSTRYAIVVAKYLVSILQSVHHLFLSQEPLPWEQRGIILKDTCCALAYLHARIPPLIHQDVKS